MRSTRPLRTLGKCAPRPRRIPAIRPHSVDATLRAIAREPRTLAYVVAVVLLVVIPLITAAKLLLTRQESDVAITRLQADSLAYERAVRALSDAVRPLAERKDPNAPLDRRLRTTITASLVKLDDLGYGAHGFGEVTERLQAVDRAWAAVVASDGAGAHVREMQGALSAVSAGVANVVRSEPGAGDAATSLLDAYGFAIPATGSRVAQNAPAQARDAFRDVAADVTRASSAFDDPRVLQGALAAAQDAVDAYAGAATENGTTLAERTTLAHDALARLRGLAATVAVNAARLLDARLAVQRRTLLWLRVDTLIAIGLALLAFGLLARNVMERGGRELLSFASKVERERIDRESRGLRDDLALSESRFAAVFDRASLGVALLGTDGRVARKNAALQALFPHASAHDLGARYPQFSQLLAGEVPGYSYEIDASTPERRAWLDVSVSLVCNDRNEPVFGVAVVKDVTERRDNDERLLRESRYDGLVGLPNRSFLIERMNEDLLHRRSLERPAGVMFIDLDGFKVINDSLGHEVGDRVLMAAARRLQSIVGPMDFVARFGGDEFVAILDGHGSRDEVIAFADKLVKQLAEPFEVAGREVYTGVSAGLAVLDRPYENVDAILRDADTAMYHAKSRGGVSCAVFDGAMREAATRHLEVAVQLRRAIEREQMYLAYQPVVEIATGRIVSFEVLLRWEHPTLGNVPPNEFIPIAEQMGLIVSIGRFVLDRACAQLAAWRSTASGFDLTHVAVNASVRELLQSDYCAVVEASMTRHGLRPGDLVLEVTESTVLQSDRYAEGTLDRLKRAGVKLSIDDFGTGYSSLRYLQTFPFDQLKIDGSFVRGNGDGLASPAIVAMLLALGRSFGVGVIAEGVETAEQLRMLEALGCEYAQGYYFERPIVAALVPAALARNTIVAVS